MTDAPIAERFASMTAALTAAGVPRDRAETAVRRELGMPTPTLDEPKRDDRVREKEEQREVVKRFRVCGFDVWSYSQPRATKQSPGVPDLLFTHREQPLATFFEVKRQRGGRVSEHQVRFAESCARTGLPYAIGDRYDAERWLIEHELGLYAGGIFEPRRQSDCSRSR